MSDQLPSDFTRSPNTSITIPDGHSFFRCVRDFPGRKEVIGKIFVGPDETYGKFPEIYERIVFDKERKTVVFDVDTSEMRSLVKEMIEFDINMFGQGSKDSYISDYTLRLFGRLNSILANNSILLVSRNDPNESDTIINPILL